MEVYYIYHPNWYITEYFFFPPTCMWSPGLLSFSGPKMYPHVVMTVANNATKDPPNTVHTNSPIHHPNYREEKEIICRETNRKGYECEGIHT